MSSSQFSLDRPMNRRRALLLGGSIAGGLMAASTPLIGRINPQATEAPAFSNEQLPVSDIEEILQSQGTVMNGVLTIEQDRNDLNNVVNSMGLPFKPSWEINNQFYFQPIGNGHIIFNGDICVLPSESNHTIDRMLSGGLTFMAFHQHFFDLHPQVFFQHFRGVGDPIAIAHAVAHVVAATGTPLPQTLPSNPTSPLDADELAHILGGTAQIGGDGVVTVSIARKETIYLQGIPLKPETGVSVTVPFEPLNGAAYTAVAPDFALIASEVDPVCKTMRDQGFVVHCLYNQETAESPQLYFSHQLAASNAYELAHKVRNGLNHMNLIFMSVTPAGERYVESGLH